MAVDGRLLRLERLDFSWTSITDETFVAVGQLAGRSLRIMEARGCSLLGRKTITDVGTAVLNAPALCACLAHARVGEEEACRGCPGAPEAATRAWAGVCALAAACGGLEALDLYDYHGCSDASAQALAVGCARLRVLKLPCCHAISDHGLVVAGSGWATSLRTLDVSYNGHVDDGSLARALAHLRCLLHLFVSGCKKITDEVPPRPLANTSARAHTHTHDARARGNVCQGFWCQAARYGRAGSLLRCALVLYLPHKYCVRHRPEGRPTEDTRGRAGARAGGAGGWAAAGAGHQQLAPPYRRGAGPVAPTPPQPRGEDLCYGGEDQCTRPSALLPSLVLLFPSPGSFRDKWERRGGGGRSSRWPTPP